MKKIILTLSLLITVAVMFAQQAEPKTMLDEKKVFGKLKLTTTIFDLNYFGSDITGVHMDGGGFTLGFVFNKIWMTGLTMNFAGTKSIRIDSTIPVINPKYNYSLYALHNEFIIGQKNVVNFSIPIKVGVGYAKFMEKYSDNQNNKTIADDAFFVAEGGACVFINIFRFMSIGGGVSYRWATDVQQIGTNDDFRNFSYEGKMRFKFYESKKSSPIPKPDL